MLSEPFDTYSSYLMINSYKVRTMLTQNLEKWKLRSMKKDILMNQRVIQKQG